MRVPQEHFHPPAVINDHDAGRMPKARGASRVSAPGPAIGQVHDCLDGAVIDVDTVPADHTGELAGGGGIVGGMERRGGHASSSARRCAAAIRLEENGGGLVRTEQFPGA